jgi:pyruvate dehydrogenase E1 component alpha subunit
MDTVARFQIEHTRFLAPNGEAVRPVPEFARDPAALIPLYRAMVRNRAFDTHSIALQRTGRLGTYVSSLGQEAVGVGVASAMLAEDVLVPSFREHGAQLWRGVTLEELFLFWGGDERGNVFAGPNQDFPNSVTVGGHTLHAAGAATAFAIRAEPRVAVCLFGDGATSKADFYEAINVAGVWELPVVFVAVNNHWAISVPREAQTAAETLAQKAIAAGIPGEQVDGNDAIAVRQVTAEAIARARTGAGASLIEALTYRLSDHTTADNASRYRDQAEVSRRWEAEPIARLRTYLVAQHTWSKADEMALISEVKAEVEAAAEAYLATPPQPPEAMFDCLFATLPAPLATERAEVLARATADEDAPAPARAAQGG